MSSTRDALSASGRSSDKISLPTLQSKMKTDPEGYVSELTLIYSQFNSSLEMFKQQAALSFTSISGVASDPSVAKDLGDRAMFLAHVTPFYPKQLAQFPNQLAEFLLSSARWLPSGLRCHVTQALILLINRKSVDIQDTLRLFMELQTLGDRTLRKLAFLHVVHSIRRMNQNHKNEAKNRALQNILFAMLQAEEEAPAKRSLTTLCELHRRRVWFDDRTANAICTACFHPSSRIMIAALSFLLDYETIENDSDGDDSSSEDELSHQAPHLVLSKEAMYKAHHKGTASSKRKKKAKLQRAMRSMKRQQRLTTEKSTSNYYSPLNHLKDAQGFAEKLFSRLQTCNERFEVKMMMLKVVARTVGLHHLILLNLYPFLQKYVQPHQRDVTTLLAAAVQACHDMVPPDAVEPLFKQIVNQFVHDRSRSEAIAVGLNVVREICLRMPLLMTEDLLQDLALYKKSHEKAVSAAARSLILLFREVCPSMLVKKDRGRPNDPRARPKAFGEVNVLSNVPGVELLQHDGDGSNEEDQSIDGDNIDEDEPISSGSDDDHNEYEMIASEDVEEDKLLSDDSESEDNELSQDDNAEANRDDGLGSTEDFDEVSGDEEDEDDIESLDMDEDVDDDDDEDEESDDEEEQQDADDSGEVTDGQARKSRPNEQRVQIKKRKISSFDGQLVAAATSLRALKKLAGTKLGVTPSDLENTILSNEDFQRIKELKAKEEAKAALSRHGLLGKGADAKAVSFKLPSSDQLSVKRVDPSKLEAHIKQKLSKEERLALVRAGREDRGKYQARTAIKQKKTGGLSNRQKEHKKAMPLAAKRAKIARSRQEKKRKHSGKQFRGKKAWKQ